MEHQIYTVIFVQCMNRSSKLWKSIVVACDELRGSSQTLTIDFQTTYEKSPKWSHQTLTSTPCQIKSSSSVWKNQNLQITWVLFFNWLIGYLPRTPLSWLFLWQLFMRWDHTGVPPVKLVIGKMHSNRGYGLVTIPRKWPTHKQWNFLVPKNIFVA